MKAGTKLRAAVAGLALLALPGLAASVSPAVSAKTADAVPAEPTGAAGTMNFAWSPAAKTAAAAATGATDGAGTTIAATAMEAAGAAVAQRATAAGGGSARTKPVGYADAGQTFVPLRFFAEAAGAEVAWDAKAKTATIARGDDEAKLILGRADAYANGERRTLNAVPFAEDGVTYVPLRFVTDALGLDAKWDSSIAAVRLRLGERAVTLPVVERGEKPGAAAPFARETRTFRVGGRAIKAELLTASLLDPRVDLSVALAHGRVGAAEELKNIAERANAKAAVNGTFFNAYTDSDEKNPYGYIAVDGKIVWKAAGDKRTILLFDANDNVELVDGANFVERFAQGGVEGALQAGPRLVRDGQVDLRVSEEGFKDPKILTGGGARSAVGVTRDHRLVLATVPGATIPQLAELMKQAGALQAMNLDGGASSGLIYDGKYVTRPGRAISNALVIQGP